MEEILNKLDRMVEDIDYNGYNSNSEVYCKLTCKDIITLARFVREHADNITGNYYIDYM